MKLDLYEHHRVRELRLVHPGDRLVMVYCLIHGAYGKPHVEELNASTASRVLPQVAVDWARELPDG